MSKYTPLGEWLRKQPQDSVELTFDQIEEMIAPNKLPDGAKRFFTFWANWRQGTPRSKTWDDAGFRTVMVDLQNEKVRFQRIRGVQEGLRPSF